MKAICTILLISALLVSCEKDETIGYPKLYTYVEMHRGEGGAFVFESASTLSPIAGLSGPYADFLDTVEVFLENSQRAFFFIEEFELLSDTEMRFAGTLDMIPFDTTVAYTMQGAQIVIGASSPYFIRLESDPDEIRVCSYVQIGVRGPNPPVSGIGYGISLGTCENDFDGHIQDIINSSIYVTGDTLGFYIIEAVYR